MRNVFIQLRGEEYQDFARFLEDRGFERVVLNVPGTRFMSKAQLLAQYARGILRLLRSVLRLRDIHHLVVFGHFGYAVKLLARAGLIRYHKLFCFAFFVHDPRLYALCRGLRSLDSRDDLYLIFSRSEIELYERHLGIERRQMIYLPYGDWGQFTWRTAEACTLPGGEYYIAGGSSNRDYAALVESFREIPARLLIVCAQSNWMELRNTALPQNVEVLRDVPSDVFEALVRGAKAGIIPLKLDTGAAGQSVALALMRNSKCVIASDAGALREYVENGVTGFLLSNLARQLPGVIDRIEKHALFRAMGRAGRARYEKKFSRDAVAAAFEKLLRSA